MNTITTDLLPLAVDITTLNVLRDNPRRGDVEAVRKSYEQFGQRKPIVARRGDRVVLAGNHQLLAARELGWPEIAVVWVDDDDATAMAFTLADNRTGDLGSYDNELLTILLASVAEDSALFAATGYDNNDLLALLNAGAPMREPVVAGSLAARFGIPPFTVLNGRSGEWMTRKQAWKSIGIQSEIGRGESLAYNNQAVQDPQFYTAKNNVENELGRTISNKEMKEEWGHRLNLINAGTSVFDPALCEVLYRWFAPHKGQVIDPWAGGSVRGIVAGIMGLNYTGIDLSQPQIEANQAQAHLVQVGATAGLGAGSGTPRWIHGDSATQLALLPREQFDMAIGCPPYYNLEVYSDDDRDLSTMGPAQFDAEMAKTMVMLAATLRPDTFAAFVVGNVRTSTGEILDMRTCMSAAASAAGMHLINDAIYLTPVGNAALRAPKPFTQARTISRIHQEVLIYCKGDRKRAAAKLLPIAAEDYNMPTETES